MGMEVGARCKIKLTSSRITSHVSIIFMILRLVAMLYNMINPQLFIQNIHKYNIIYCDVLFLWLCDKVLLNAQMFF